MLKFNPKKLMELRKRKGITQIELSRLSGVHRATINRLENPNVHQRRGISVEGLALLAHALDTKNFNQFFTDESEIETRETGRTVEEIRTDAAAAHLRKSLSTLEGINSPKADRVRELLAELEK